MLIPRRILGFGFALFLTMVLLAFIYAQFQAREMSSSPNTATPKSMQTEQSVPASERPLPLTITPETVTEDLIDEAMADREDLEASEADEAEAYRTGAENLNSLNSVYVEE